MAEIKENTNAPLEQSNQEPNSANTDFRDLGFGTRISRSNKRLINKDGSFNVRRVGGGIGAINPYQFLITISWTQFLLLVVGFYGLLNTLFASLYLLVGVESLSAAPYGDPATLKYWIESFLHAFFFSVQTLTTVGYGSVSPVGFWSNLIASIEAFTGLMIFALATGVFFGRFSKASAKIAYSQSAIIAPFHDINGFMFRIVNRRQNQLIELDVQVVLMLYEQIDGEIRQKYFRLELERSYVAMFPLTWTVVHPIDAKSPLYRKSKEELMNMNAEFLVMLKGYDDTFDQVVHSRNSYKCHEIEWGKKFIPIYQTDEKNGMVIVEVDKIDLAMDMELNEY
ncbi:MAG: hypothetical protein KDE26_24785 [Bacteroidetes bacterium]|nr:hypothetical protein [Bacteroidota bacterium]